MQQHHSLVFPYAVGTIPKLLGLATSEVILDMAPSHSLFRYRESFVSCEYQGFGVGSQLVVTCSSTGMCFVSCDGEEVHQEPVESERELEREILKRHLYIRIERHCGTMQRREM